ncbi:MAG: hypothetical protein E2O68_06545 [Deltaproteobacteria bacterium]|nr:MAG: hypothetical protein E2O68_06545 [Deltaproteobacteria bacterium]
MKKFIIYLVLQHFLFTGLFASELDNFTHRYRPLKDSRILINRKANSILRDVAFKLNRQKRGCREKELYRQLRKHFNIMILSKFPKWIEHNKKIDRYHPKPKNSLYRDWSFKESPAMKIYSHFIPIVMGPELNFNGDRIGLDKFEHLLGYGYDNFKTYHVEEKGIHEVFIKGFKDEYGQLGAKGTGVMSYGDMSADFNGMRFWNNILKKDYDVMELSGLSKKVIGPYLLCVKNQWAINQKIDFRDYLDASMDEGINCSKFKKVSMAKKVKSYLKGLEKKYKKRFTCPIRPNLLRKMFKKYGQFSKYIINLDGHQGVPLKSGREIYNQLKTLK